MCRTVFLVALMGVSSAACSDSGTPVVEVSRIEIVAPVSYNDFYRGDTLRLVADITTSDGSSVSVSWSSDRPDIASMAGGLLTNLSPESEYVEITASAGGVSTTELVRTSGWDVFESVDPISGRANVRANLSGLALFQSGGSLEIRCRSGVLELFVSTGYVTDSGVVRYRLSGLNPTTETWSEATNYQAYFYPGSVSGFVGLLAQHDTMVFEGREFQGGPRVSKLLIRDIEMVYPQVLDACS